MLLRIGFSMLTMVLGISTGVLAQEQGTFSGHYSTVRLSADTLMVPEGPTVVRVTYRISVFADNPNSPFNQNMGHCMATSVLGTDGTPVAGGGGCHFSDAEGSGYWQWWQMDEGGTLSCPIMCGSFGHYNGYGEFAGLSGGGTFRVVASFPDGSNMGTAEGTFERR